MTTVDRLADGAIQSTKSGILQWSIIQCTSGAEFANSSSQWEARALNNNKQDCCHFHYRSAVITRLKTLSWFWRTIDYAISFYWMNFFSARQLSFKDVLKGIKHMFTVYFYIKATHEKLDAHSNSYRSVHLLVQSTVFIITHTRAFSFYWDNLTRWFIWEAFTLNPNFSLCADGFLHFERLIFVLFKT